MVLTLIALAVTVIVGTALSDRLKIAAPMLLIVVGILGSYLPLLLMIGATPQSDWLPDRVLRDEHGFVLTGRDVPPEVGGGELPPVELATAVPGVYAVGDLRSGSMKRVASATGGASVVSHVHAQLAVG